MDRSPAHIVYVVYVTPSMDNLKGMMMDQEASGLVAYYWLDVPGIRPSTDLGHAEEVIYLVPSGDPLPPFSWRR